jgi:predicted DCC family thiol-disulfide oxidoreductase YuxK
VAGRPRAENTTDGALEGPVLLYDGVCGLCNWTVRVVLRLDRRGRIRFAPLGGDFAASVLVRHPELRWVDSLVLVEPPGEAGEPGVPASGRGPTDGRSATVERVFVKSDAVLRLAHHLGGPWRLSGVLRVLPRGLRDRAYDLLARHRYALFGRFDERPPPPVDARARFLD